MDLIDDCAEEVEEQDIKLPLIYKNYIPKFSSYKGVKLWDHPGKICEPTSLSYVQLPDVSPNVDFDLELLRDGKITALQFETIVYAIRSFDILLADGTRCGFLCGDGPGVGKTRTICGLIVHYKRKKILWITSSADLFIDIRDEIAKLDYNIRCANFKEIDRKISNLNKYECDVLICTYPSLIKHYERVVSFLGSNDFEGMIILDECHAAKNAEDTQTGSHVIELQSKFPKACVFYSSATMASDITHLSYMSRLGLWGEGTCFRNADAFMDVIPTSGVSAIELVAVDLKRRGVYLSRQISFENVGYFIHEVERTGHFQRLYDKCALLWRKMIQYADSLAELNEGVEKPSAKKNKQAKSDNVGKRQKSVKGTIFSTLWSANQRFFLCLMTSSKVPTAIKIARREMSKNKSVVIGLQGTGEASLIHYMEGRTEYNALSVARETLERQLKRLFGYTAEELSKIPATPDSSSEDDDVDDSQDSDEDMDKLTYSSKRARSRSPSMSNSSGSEHESSDEDDHGDTDTQSGESSAAAKRPKLKIKHNRKELHKLKSFCNPLLNYILPRLPQNALDALVEQLGGRKNVAEMTGRVTAMEYDKKLDTYYAHRRRNRTNDNANINERHKFMYSNEDGFIKRYAIISDVASTGISLHAAKDCDNKFPRVHITLELPWSPEKAIQQFGRTNRTNQVEPPEYVTIKSPVPGEHRIISAIVQRLTMMGAITKGDHKATDNVLCDEFNFDHAYGNKGLKVMSQLIKSGDLDAIYDDDLGASRSRKPTVDTLTKLLQEGFIFDHKGDFQRQGNQVEKFLNRVLAMELKKQDILMDVFKRCVEKAVSDDKANDLYDSGIKDYKLREMGKVRGDVGTISWTGILKGNPDRVVEIHTVTIDRGRKWGSVNAYFNSAGRKFGVECLTSSGQMNTAIVMYVPNKAKSNDYHKIGTVYSPSFNKRTDVNYARLDGFTVQNDYETCKILWRKQYDLMDFKKTSVLQATGGEYKKCIHEYLNGSCLARSCTDHARIRQCHILTGSVTELWEDLKKIEKPLTSMRLEMKDGTILIGVKISPQNVDELKEIIQHL